MVEKVDGVEVEISGDLSEYEQALKDAMRETRTATTAMVRSLRKVGESAVNLGRKLTTRLTLPITILAGFFIKAASDAEEMESKFRVVFGNSADDVAKWAGVLGESVGRSRFELMEMAAQVQDTFVPLGFARDTAAEMSKALTTLSIDVASFNNVQDVDVMRDFQSALVGNTETVRKYGIVITEAVLQQELQTLGLGDLSGAAEQQAKVLGRLNLIFQNTTDAQGDASRTAGSFANQLRALMSQWAELSVTMGQIFMPVARVVLAAVRLMVVRFKELDTSTKVIISTIAVLVAAIGPLLITFGLMANGIAALTVVLAAMTRAIIAGTVIAVVALSKAISAILIVALKGLSVALGAVVRLLALVLSSVGLAVAAVVGLGVAFTVFKDTAIIAATGVKNAITKFISNTIDNTVQRAKQLFAELINKFIEVKNAVTELFGGDPIDLVVVPTLDLKETDFTGDISAQMAAAREQAQVEANAFIETLSGFRDRAGEIFGDAFEGLTDIDLDLPSLEKQITDLFMNASDDASGFADQIKELIQGFENFGAAAGDVDQKRADAADAAAARTANAIADFKNLGDVAKNVKNTIIDLIKQILIVEPLTDALRSGFRSLIGVPNIVPGTGSAGGGTIRGGVPELVGERGPELFIPRGSGSVVNNAGSKRLMQQGGVTVEQNLVFTAPVQKDTLAMIMAARPFLQQDSQTAISLAMKGVNF